VNALQKELQHANSALAKEISQNEVLQARLVAHSLDPRGYKICQELQSDLSGLIFLNVERTKSNTVFDCLQTGRNGSTFLRFPSDDSTTL
jgi:Chromosome segregation protein Csm1/Pcs1